MELDSSHTVWPWTAHLAHDNARDKSEDALLYSSSALLL